MVCDVPELSQRVTDCRLVRNSETGSLRMAFLGFTTAALAQLAVSKFNHSFIGSQRISAEIATGLTESTLSRFSRLGRNDKRMRESELAAAGASNVPTQPEAVDEEDLEARATANREKLGNMTDSDFLSSLVASDGESAIHQSTDAPSVACPRVFVTNIPFGATEASLRGFFSSCSGPVQSCHIPLTKETKTSKGCAYVTFANVADATKAISLSGCVFMGRVIRITVADPDPYARKDTELPTDFKSSRLAEKRQSEVAGSATAAWNPLFMASNTAIAAVAKKLQVDIGNIASVETPGAAVRAAVAEAHLTSEAARSLGDEGIRLDVINGHNALHRDRSNTTILIKNLPAKGTYDDRELFALFARFGSLDVTATPSSGGFHLIGFANAQDARTAFSRLAYRKFHGQPLFLEWAVVGSLKNEDEEGGDSSEKQQGTADVDAVATGDTVYVTNLPFQITDDEFSEFLRDLCPRISTRSELIENINLLPDKGRAFIKVKDAATLNYLLSRLRGKSFNGREISAQVSTSVKAQVAAASEDTNLVPPGRNPLKLLVKNLPFEATEDDLRRLFAAFTDIRAVRIPKRHNAFNAHHANNHRGFGFVEFLTAKEATTALSKLSSTHLYGRHLVLEYAKEE